MQQSFWNQPTAPHLLSTEFQFNSLLLCTTIWLHNYMQNKALVLLPEVDIEWFLSKLETFSFISILHISCRTYIVTSIFLLKNIWVDFRSQGFFQHVSSESRYRNSSFFYGWLSSCKIFLVGLSTSNRLKETFKKHIVSVVSSL